MPAQSCQTQPHTQQPVWQGLARHSHRCRALTPIQGSSVSAIRHRAATFLGQRIRDPATAWAKKSLAGKMWKTEQETSLFAVPAGWSCSLT